jgi:hypothetical protein
MAGMTPSSIIALWPSTQAFADDIGEAVGTVHVWKSRGRIPPHAVSRIFAAARGRGLPLDIGDGGHLVPASPGAAA